jgi:hypothetical protein
MSITPNAEQLGAYARPDLGGEVVMVNLLKSRRTGGAGQSSGREGYGRHGVAGRKMIEERGRFPAHREDGLADTVVIACAPAPDFGAGAR